jgi:hypothetical protein
MSKERIKAVARAGETQDLSSRREFSPEEIEEMRGLARRVIESGAVIDQPPDFSSEYEQWEFGRQLAIEGRRDIDNGSQRIGLGLLLMRSTKRYGEWEAFVRKEISISPQHARKLMRVAEFLVELPDSNRARVRDLSFRRQETLARMGKQVVAELEDDGVLEEISSMSNPEFQAFINERKAREHAERQLEKAQDEYRQDIHRKKLKETVLQGIPDAIQQARRFSALVGSMGMELSIRGQIIFERTRASEELHGDQNARAIQFRQATAAQLAGIDAALQALLDLRNHILEHAGEVTVHDIPGLHAVELDEALDNYRYMLDAHGQRAEHIGVPSNRRGKRNKV